MIHCTDLSRFVWSDKKDTALMKSQSRRRFLLTALLTLFINLPALMIADTRVTLQLRWDHQFQFAGYYAALWEGYYKQAGLDVDLVSAINPDDSIRSAIEEVENGNAEFGIGSADILLARDRGIPLVVVASIFQQSGAAFFAPQEAGLHTLADLVNLRVSRRVGDLIDIEFQAMLRAEGIDPDTITPYPFDQSKGYLAEMAAGNIDVIPGYIIGTPHEAAQLGIELKTLRPLAYGVDFYGDSLFTSRDIAVKDPELVIAFRDASLRGWEYALNHPLKIADRILKEYQPSFPIHDFNSFLHVQISPVLELTLFPIVQTGNVNPARWERMNTTLRELGMVESEFDPQTAIFDPERDRALQQAKIRFWSLIVILTIGLLLVAVLLWGWLLRRALRIRTAELKTKERQYKDLVERTPAIIYTFQPGYGATFYSPYVRILGYSPEELLAAPLLWNQSIHPEDKRHIEEAIAEAMNGKAIKIEYRIRHKLGHWIWFLDRTFPRIEKDGTILFDGIALDITGLKTSEEKLRSLILEKDFLLKEVNHRVKNNLMMINSLIRMKDAELGPDVDLSDLLHRIDAIRIVHEKLNESESISEIRLKDYIEELLPTIFSLSRTPVEIESQIEEIIVPTQTAIPLGIVIIELATNTVKHGLHAEKPRFVISIRRDQVNRLYSIEISNNGPPFPEGVELATSQSLGLRLITSLVRQLEGSITLTRGPCFSVLIQLPVKQRNL
jgi:PAS domain S-box-containing protein